MMIIPYYIRYTEFTLEDRLILEDYAWARASTVTSLNTVKQQRQQLAVSQVDPRLLDKYDAHVEHLQCRIDDIDEAIRAIYVEYGRVN
jgi:hypothetical protein